MKPKLIIFDNDGVLIDSDLVWHTVNVLEMKRLGFSINMEKSIEIQTCSIQEGFDNVMLQEYGKTITDADRSMINQKTEAAYSQKLKAVKDIALVLDYVTERDIQKCIASNADNDYIISTLKITNLMAYFDPDKIFSAPMVNNKRKPAPDIFLYVAKKFNMDPKDCLVVEDHPLGIEAANVAGMPAIGFLGAFHAQNPLYRECVIKSNPILIAHNATELLNILKKIFN